MLKTYSKIKKHFLKFEKDLFKRMLDLSTTAFGLVAALAWNEVIKEFVDQTIKPLFGDSSGLVSLLIYALLVTILAVIVTYNLTKLVKGK